MAPGWIPALQPQAGACVLVTVIEVRGSAPRGVGAWMLVDAGGCRGSIGGGRLEFAAQALAREMLDAAAPAQRVERYGLGPDMDQCCGGAVRLLFQRLDASRQHWLLEALDRPGALLATAINDPEPRFDLYPDPRDPARSPELATAAREVARDGLARLAGDGEVLLMPVTQAWPVLYLFGAGHVGTALVQTLRDLPIQVHWADGREGAFPDPLPANVASATASDPLALVAAAPGNALFLVMTHSHPLDEDLCHAVLSRPDFGWLGLIGSASKRARFVHRLGKRGIPTGPLERLHCPVGLPGITGKRPQTIAMAIAAQLLAEHVPEALR